MAAVLSKHSFGFSNGNSKSICIRSRTNTMSLAHLNEPRISASAALLAGRPGCVWLVAVNTVPATFTIEQSVDRLSIPGVPPKLLSANASKVSGAPSMLLA